MEELEKKTTDLSQLFKQKGQDFSQTGANAPNVPKQVSSFSKAKKKQKIELMVLIVIIVLAIAVFIYYFTMNRGNQPPIEPIYIPAADGGI